MNFKKLEAFISVLEKKSFSEAAAALKGSQPAVSLKIKSLEEEVGIDLLDRSHSGIQPTPAGIMVYKAAKEIMQIWGRLEDDLHGFHDSLTGSLTIGASTIPGTYLIPAWIKNFRILFPRVDVAIEISDSKTILNKLLDHQVDVAITGLQNHSTKLTDKPIASDTLVLIVPLGHTLLKSGFTKISELHQYDAVLREEGSGTRKKMEELLEINGSSLRNFRTTISFGSSEAIISAVEAGLGISFVSKLAAVPAEKANRIRIIETTQPYDRQFYFTALREAMNRPVIREFADVIQKAAEPL